MNEDKVTEVPEVGFRFKPEDLVRKNDPELEVYPYKPIIHTPFTIGRPQSFEEACRAVFERQLALMLKKREDYGTQNILLTGEIGVAVRSQDKLARILNLTKKGEANAAVAESLDDTWGDLMNYALIALTLREGTYELPSPKLSEAKLQQQRMKDPLNKTYGRCD